MKIWVKYLVASINFQCGSIKMAQLNYLCSWFYLDNWSILLVSWVSRARCNLFLQLRDGSPDRWLFSSNSNIISSKPLCVSTSWNLKCLLISYLVLRNFTSQSLESRRQTTNIRKLSFHEWTRSILWMPNANAQNFTSSSRSGSMKKEAAARSEAFHLSIIV